MTEPNEEDDERCDRPDEEYGAQRPDEVVERPNVQGGLLRRERGPILGVALYPLEEQRRTGHKAQPGGDETGGERQAGRTSTAATGRLRGALDR